MKFHIQLSHPYTTVGDIIRLSGPNENCQQISLLHFVGTLVIHSNFWQLLANLIANIYHDRYLVFDPSSQRSKLLVKIAVEEVLTLGDFHQLPQLAYKIFLCFRPV